MDPLIKTICRRLFPLAFLILAIGLACTCNGLSQIGKPTSSPPVPATLPPNLPATLPPNVPATLPPSPPPTLAQGALNSSAPWMIIGTSEGIWAANPDGTGMKQIVNGDQWESDFSRSIQPMGNLVVVLTSETDHYHHLALNLLSLPDGKVEKVTDLSNAQSEPAADAGPGTDAMEAMRAISDQLSYSWSPDGTKVAFIGAMDGPSADVFIYDLKAKTIVRVSNDTAQDYAPSWSPDGKHLLFFSVKGFGTGAGYVMDGAWSANGDGSGVGLLYRPTSAGEEMLGWRDSQTAVLESWDVVNGPAHLRLYNIITKKTTMLMDGSAAGAVADVGNLFTPANPGTVFFGDTTGLYLQASNQTTPNLLSGNTVDSVNWDRESNMFVVKFRDGGLATFQDDGSAREDAPAALSTKGYATINVAMYGLIWGWTSNGGDTPGAWISGPGLDIPQLTNQPAIAPLWDPHNNLTFFRGTSLYRVTFDSHYTDLAAVTDVSGDVQEAAWVGAKGFDIYGP